MSGVDKQLIFQIPYPPKMGKTSPIQSQVPLFSSPSQKFLGHQHRSPPYLPVKRKAIRKISPRDTWKMEEHERLQEGVRAFTGTRARWNKIAKLVGSRTPLQCKSHYQKFRDRVFIEKRYEYQEMDDAKSYLTKYTEEAYHQEVDYYLINKVGKPMAKHILLKCLEIFLKVIHIFELKKNRANFLIDNNVEETKYMYINEINEKAKELCDDDSLSEDSIKCSQISNDPSNKEEAGSWTQMEDEILTKYMSIYGKQWKLIANHLPSRTARQCKSHYQKFCDKRFKEKKYSRMELEKTKRYLRKEVLLALKKGKLEEIGTLKYIIITEVEKEILNGQMKEDDFEEGILFLLEDIDYKLENIEYLQGANEFYDISEDLPHPFCSGSGYNLLSTGHPSTCRMLIPYVNNHIMHFYPIQSSVQMLLNSKEKGLISFYPFLFDNNKPSQ